MEPIEQEFAARGVIRGAVLMFRPQHALDMVRQCRERGLRVLGLDGFKLTAKTTQPVMEQSIDLSWPTDRNDAWSRAESFLAERLESDLYFEVVIGT
jgi:hypothetical protein